MIYIAVIESEGNFVAFVKADNIKDAEKLASVLGDVYSIYRLTTSDLLTLQENKQVLIIP